MERAAFAYARKLCFEPHRVGKEDYLALREHLTDVQAFEYIFWIACYNLTNRWAEVLSIPLESHRSFVTPVPADYVDRSTLLAPVGPRNAKTGQIEPLIATRPKWESREEVEAALAACRKRTPYLALAPVKDTLPLIPEWTAKEAPGVLPSKQSAANWMLLNALFPKAGGYKIQGTIGEAGKGKIDKRLAAQISWICARHDRAWYAVGQAKRRLLALGESLDAIYALDGDWKSFSPKDQAVFAVARKITIAPASVTDDDISGLRKLYTDSQVAEVVYRSCSASFFNRVTEPCGLRLED